MLTLEAVLSAFTMGVLLGGIVTGHLLKPRWVKHNPAIKVEFNGFIIIRYRASNIQLFMDISAPLID